MTDQKLNFKKVIEGKEGARRERLVGSGSDGGGGGNRRETGGSAALATVGLKNKKRMKPPKEVIDGSKAHLT